MFDMEYCSNMSDAGIRAVATACTHLTILGHYSLKDAQVTQQLLRDSGIEFALLV